MIDMHYDLLSILYYSYLKNDFSYINELKKYFNDNNVNGVIANLYFMDRESMKSEIGNKEINVKEMFKVSISLFKKYFPNVKVIFSIEGCDYIDINELDELKKIGLGSILLTWNNKNIYGSGAKGDGGLTELGKCFLRKSIDLGLIIDLSHMNENTFYDTVKLLKEEKSKGKNIKVILSHSNCYNICSVPRNVKDKQIESLKDLDVIIGLVSYSHFISKDTFEVEKLRNIYLEHINYVVGILGIDHVGIATDDMMFDNILFGKDKIDGVFSYKSLKKDLYKLLEKYYNKSDIEKILYKNIERLFN